MLKVTGLAPFIRTLTFLFSNKIILIFGFTFALRGTTKGDFLCRKLFWERGAIDLFFDSFAPLMGPELSEELPSGSLFSVI